jgi:hypothetical protein
MNASSNSSADAPRPSLDLDLPDAEGFRSMPPLVSIEHMIRTNKRFRALFPNGIPTEEERWARKRDVEFRL